MTEDTPPEAREETRPGIFFNGVFIAEDDAVSFMRDHAKISAHCPSCKHDTTEVYLGSHSENAITYFPSFTITFQPGKTIPVFFAICSRCGYLRPHSLITLAAWVKGKEASS